MKQKIVLEAVAYGVAYRYETTMDPSNPLTEDEWHAYVEEVSEVISGKGRIQMMDDTRGWVAINPAFVVHAYMEETG